MTHKSVFRANLQVQGLSSLDLGQFDSKTTLTSFQHLQGIDFQAPLFTKVESSITLLPFISTFDNLEKYLNFFASIRAIIRIDTLISSIITHGVLLCQLGSTWAQRITADRASCNSPRLIFSA
jgi:hypothetical protein